MKIADGVEMLEMTGHPMGTVSIIHPTLIWDQDKVILVDTGFPGQLDLLKAEIEKTGLAFDRVNTIILTHHDIDHIGGLASLLKGLSGQVTVMAYEVEKDYIQGDKRPLKLAQLEARLESDSTDLRKLYEALERGFQGSFAPVDKSLHDGEVLPFAGGIQVIFTPGHTLGHICLYLKQSKVLISGDALTVNEGKLVMMPERTNFDQALCRTSLKKLTALDIKQIICYHGGLFQDNPSRRISEIVNE